MKKKKKILAEFHQICLAQEYITQGGITYAKEMLESALGSQKAIDILNQLTATLQVRPFDFARKADPGQILNFIQNENSQTIALVCLTCNRIKRPSFYPRFPGEAGRCRQTDRADGQHFPGSD